MSDDTPTLYVRGRLPDYTPKMDGSNPQPWHDAKSMQTFIAMAVADGVLVPVEPVGTLTIAVPSMIGNGVFVAPGEYVLSRVSDE